MKTPSTDTVFISDIGPVPNPHRRATIAERPAPAPAPVSKSIEPAPAPKKSAPRPTKKKGKR